VLMAAHLHCVCHFAYVYAKHHHQLWHGLGATIFIWAVSKQKSSDLCGSKVRNFYMAMYGEESTQ
jgi:hypothetical protein